MPAELRKIIFSKEELKSAAYGYCLNMGKPMSDAIVADVSVKSEPELHLVLRFDGPQTQVANTVELARSEVAAALIRYCRTIGVPIPRTGQKGLQATDDGLVMMINLQHQGPKSQAA